MGEARRRKLLGLYPDGSTPKTSLGSSTQRTERLLLCVSCGEGGGTLAATRRDLRSPTVPSGHRPEENQDVFVHVPDCQHAAASRARLVHRWNVWMQKVGLRKPQPTTTEAT